MRALQNALENPTKKTDTLKFATKLVKEFNIHVNTECYGGNTALHYACLLNDKDMVMLLLEKGSDAGLKNHNKKTEKDLTTDEEVRICHHRKTLTSKFRFILYLSLDVYVLKYAFLPWIVTVVLLECNQ